MKTRQQLYQQYDYAHQELLKYFDIIHVGTLDTEKDILLVAFKLTT